MYIILISSSLQTFAIFLVPSALTFRHSSTLSSAASTAVYAAQWITASGFASFITLWQASASVISISSTSTPMPSIPFAARSSITSWPNCPFTPVTRTLIYLTPHSFRISTMAQRLAAANVLSLSAFAAVSHTFVSLIYRRFPYILSK